MSVPGNINTAPPPSSFDDNPDFYEESRWQKLKRRLIEDPLIPLGCALTCWALFEATRSIRTGDRHRTNRMFRRRIYAQGFTILAMLAGSAYWESDRAKRKQYDKLVGEKEKKERHEAWIRELEVREEEEQELRRMRNQIINGTKPEAAKSAEIAGQTDPATADGKKNGGWGGVQSVLEEHDLKRRPIFRAARDLWESSR